MASEFDFLRVKWPKLAAIAADASRLVDISPSSAINSLQTYCQWAADIALDIFEIQVSGGASQMERLEAIQASGLVPAEILQKFHNVRSAGNRTLQELKSSTDLARACVSDCRDIGQWLFREADKEGWPRSESYAPRYGRIPIEGMAGAPKYDPEFGGSGMGFSRIMRRYGSYITLAAGLLIIAGIAAAVIIGLSNRAQNQQQLLITPTPVAETTPMPDSISLATATPEPTATLEPFVYIEELQPSNKWDEYFHTGKWNYKGNTNNFKVNGTVYEHGIGMFIDSRTILENEARKEASYNLNGMFNKISFSIGADQDFGRYDNRQISGTYIVVIECDGVTVYDSGRQDYEFFAEESVTLTQLGAPSPQRMVIKLIQRKGEKGTLNIVLADFKLYYDPSVSSN